MNQIVIKHGIYAGLISTAGYVVFAFIDTKSTGSEVVGYAAMIVALSFVFIGMRKLKQANGGNLSFKEGFLNGLYMVVIASCFYVIGWEIYFPNFMPDFATDYQTQMIESMKTEGASAEEIETARKEMNEWIENYQNPLIRLPMTFLEIFPVGLIIALFSALILKKPVKPAAT